jgi:hypothetical protein
MIPTNTQSGVLPPFLPEESPSNMGAVAPYRVSLREVAERYSTSPVRIEILYGLLEFRKGLRSIGITEGFQWVDGSFVEDCENNRGHPPSDVDVITYSVRPESCKDDEAWRQLIQSRPDLFHPVESKRSYKCDAYFVDLGVHPVHLVSQTRYWFGLFSHQRETFLWKGMLEVPLNDDDAAVEQFLRQGGIHASQT